MKLIIFLLLQETPERQFDLGIVWRTILKMPWKRKRKQPLHHKGIMIVPLATQMSQLAIGVPGRLLVEQKYFCELGELCVLCEKSSLNGRVSKFTRESSHKVHQAHKLLYLTG
jgi:hypothetical protein